MAPHKVARRIRRGLLGNRLGTGREGPAIQQHGDRTVGAACGVESPPASPRETDPAEEAEQTFARLRCGVCHARDDRSSLLPVVLAEESDTGHLAESLPNLTWTGERLHATWMEQFLAGQLPARPRPHLKMRMPAFPAYSRGLSNGLAAQHGIDAAEPQDGVAAESGQELAVGYRLTTRDGGLDCRQCHGVGTQPPQGDAKTLLAQGINFAMVGDRLRYDFYRRFVLDPPRYDINTRMPKLSADGRTTSVPHIYHGDAGKQFDAIWQYLQTIDGTEP